MIVAHDTPECEQRQMEDTLGMDPHTMVGPFIVAYKVNPCTGKSEGTCACGRTQTWFDVVNTALHVHSAVNGGRALDENVTASSQEYVT
jgi:hypothetical protein